jgi:hypothetical protein
MLAAQMQKSSGRRFPNLPEPISDLVGRDSELREILSLAAAHRLVTLTGAGGIGKTRLALAVARERLPELADGAWIAELAPLADPDPVPATVAAAVRLKFAAPFYEAVRQARWHDWGGDRATIFHTGKWAASSRRVYKKEAPGVNEQSVVKSPIQVRIHLPPPASQVRTCLWREFAFLRR